MKKTYENTFAQGVDLVKKLTVVAAISLVASIVLEQMGNAWNTAFLILTIVVFAATFYVIRKFCVCPHCGRHISTGIFTVTTCPSCKHSLYTGKKVKQSKTPKS